MLPLKKFSRHELFSPAFRRTGMSSTKKNAKSPGLLRGFAFKVGDYLLSRDCSTIGVDGLNFSVRNGKRWIPAAIVTLRS